MMFSLHKLIYNGAFLSINRAEIIPYYISKAFSCMKRTLVFIFFLLLEIQHFQIHGSDGCGTLAELTALLIDQR